ncbi:MAG: acetylornithine deacetylase [Gammaproteobacteria bacterium RIFCSPLOWO2_02_FULL_57_10]|nr:MAG: acetylornithine deacetylase [Gammaproteobacteria bacterium RIFCSPLOWO2_02_FULL_57_10]
MNLSADLLIHLDALIRLPSVSSANPALDTSNAPVIEYLAQCFTDLGFTTEIIASPGTSPETAGNRKLNLIATLGSGPGGLVLAGHTDTVPLNEELWSVNPFRLTEKDGRLYGLGSTDMKSFFPLVMEAVKAFKGETLKQPLIVLATADEETSMQGARTIAELGRPKARCAIIGEPTGMRPINAHKGIMMESIDLLGQSGHSSDPDLGRNALDAMHAVISELIVFRGDLQKRYNNPIFTIPRPTLNLGCIHGGDNPNRICGQCCLEYDIRLLPGMEIAAMRDEIRTRVLPIAERFGVQATLKPLFAGLPAFMTAPDNELVRTAERLTGNSAATVAFGTEGPLLQKLGMSTIILGPGDIDQAHQPDEYLSLDRIQPCIDVLKKLIAHYCL